MEIAGPVVSVSVIWRVIDNSYMIVIRRIINALLFPGFVECSGLAVDLDATGTSVTGNVL